MLDVKEAAKLASENLVALLGQDSVSGVRLEEVELVNEGDWTRHTPENVQPEDSDTWDASYWLITVSYLPVSPNPLIPGEQQRQYKIFKIDAETGDLVAMKIRKAAQTMDYYVELLYRYRSKGILIDTNLLLVYFVGNYDPSLIPRFKRTLTFAVEDFYILERAFQFFSKVVTTPNILTEVNSFSNQLPEVIKLAYYTKMAEQVSVLEEHYLISRKICALEHFKKFGLTDSGLIELVKGNYLVLTDDFRLANYMQNVGIDVINFNHIRTLNWKI